MTILASVLLSAGCSDRPRAFAWIGGEEKRPIAPVVGCREAEAATA